MEEYDSKATETYKNYFYEATYSTFHPTFQDEIYTSQLMKEC